MIKVIFCALNEEQSLKKFLIDLSHELQILATKYNQESEIIVCLDGSTDKSFELVSALQDFHPITILPLKNQRGLGLAYKRLFKHILNNENEDDDIIISLDSDNTHNPNQIHEMFEYFNENSLDFLVASRYCNTSIMKEFPLHRKCVSKAVSILFQSLFRVKKINGQKLLDFTSGYRFYKLEKLKELYKNRGDKIITEPEFTYTCELVVRLARLKSRIDEIAISYEYNNKIGKSKLRLGRNFIRLIALTFKLLFFK